MSTAHSPLCFHQVLPVRSVGGAFGAGPQKVLRVHFLQLLRLLLWRWPCCGSELVTSSMRIVTAVWGGWSLLRCCWVPGQAALASAW